MQCKTGLFKAFLYIIIYVNTLIQAVASVQDSQPLVLLFHGLGSKPIAFHALKQDIENALPVATVIALEAVEGEKSLHLPVKAQAHACLCEVQRKVKDLNKRAIVLIGHSQGGLRAYAFLKQFKAQLNIKGLIAISVPWEGVPGARVDEHMLAQHLTEDVIKDIEELSVMLGYPRDRLIKQLRLEIKKNQWMQLFPGAKDLAVNSKFLKDVALCLAKEDSPIVAIAGGNENFLDLVPKQKGKSYLKHLNNVYAFFVTGQSGKQGCMHDMWIPCFSQHALHVVSAHKKNFTRVAFNDAFHSRKIWAMIPVPEHKQILLHSGVRETVIQCTKQFLAL